MKEFIKTIIIDDEQDGRLVLESLLKTYCPNIKIVALCESSEEGIKAINETKPDLVFLDVEMPKTNGFSMLQKLPQIDFDIIFVTAYDQYALNAIKFSALDYLVKPVDVEELKISVAKYQKNQESKDNKRANFFLENHTNDGKLFNQMVLPVRDGYIFVEIDDIVRFEGDGNYTHVIFKNGSKQLVAKTLKEFELNLNQHSFARVHKSHLVNLKYIRKYTRGDGGTLLMSDNSEIEVSRRNKESFLNLFKL